MRLPRNEPPFRYPGDSSGGLVLLERATLLFCFLLPFSIVPLAFGRSVAAPAVAVLLIAWLGCRRSALASSGIGLGVGLALGALVVWSLIGMYWTVSATLTMTALGALCVKAAILIALTHGLPGCWLRSLMMYGHGSVILALWILYTPAEATRAGRAQIAGIDENVTGMALAIGFAALLYLAFRARAGWRAVWLLEIAIVIIGTLHLGSRSAVLACAAVGVATLVRAAIVADQTGRRRIVSAALVMGAVAASIGPLEQQGLVSSRIADFLRAPFHQGDSNRSAIISDYLLTRDHWYIRGIGLGGDSTYLTATTGVSQNAHSAFWKTWIELGLPGLAAFGAILALIAWRAWGKETSEAFLLLSIPVAVFAVALGGDRTIPFWYVLALGLAGSRVRGATATASENPPTPTASKLAPAGAPSASRLLRN